MGTPKGMSPEPKIDTPKVMSPEPKINTPKVMSPEPVVKPIRSTCKSPEPEIKSVTPMKMSPEPQTKPIPEHLETPEIEVKETTIKDEPTIKEENIQPEVSVEKPIDDTKEEKVPVPDVKEDISLDAEEKSGEDKMTEEEVKEMVAKVEGKCKNIRGDIADMAMSEQYLRTKQALLMAKKKEQEMKIAEKMAAIRETEVE